MQEMARVAGTMNPTAHTFEMAATEITGARRTATISGSIEPNGWFDANINGPNVKCTNVKVRWFAPYQGAG